MNKQIDDNNGTTVLLRSTEYQPRRSWRTWLIGRPLSTADAPHQTIGKAVGLAVFSSDALSSVAYSTQEMLIVLAAAGSLAYGVIFPMALAIVALLAILTLSYEQTIHAYPNGGGSYIVSRDNLGHLPAQIAAAALLTDYILTVAVSVSSGVAQIVSAYPQIISYRAWVAIGFVALIMLVNLRGVKESGVTFAVPTYLFLVLMLLMIGVGLMRYFSGDLTVITDPPPVEAGQVVSGLTLFLILRAFSSGTTALTGVEAISNGIPAFREPRSSNAGKTLVMMSVILAIMLLGLSYLAGHIQTVASEEETVISQLARAIYQGRGLLYGLTIASTTIILVMAANTAFADFPRLSALTAIDGFLPRQLAYRGSRLVYSRGIITLALIASVLIFVFNASVTRLIPLYAIGVFLSFTLSQGGMARRWWKIGHMPPGEEKKERGSVLRFEKNWELKMIINGFGAFLTAIVVIVFAVTKFSQGAWLIVIIIPLIVLALGAIHRHYATIASDLSLEHSKSPSRFGHHRVVLPIGGVHRGTLIALRYARSLSDDVTAVHVSIDPEDTARIQQKWQLWGEGVRLVILESPYRLFIEPLLEYIEGIDQHRDPGDVVTIVVPEFVPRHWYDNFLHARTANTLRWALQSRKGIIITNVPYQVH